MRGYTFIAVLRAAFILSAVRRKGYVKMAIGSATQRGNVVYVFGDRGNQLFSQLGELVGYTQSSVSIRRGNYVYIFNERGNQTGGHMG